MTYVALGLAIGWLVRELVAARGRAALVEERDLLRASATDANGRAMKGQLEAASARRERDAVVAENLVLKGRLREVETPDEWLARLGKS